MSIFDSFQPFCSEVWRDKYRYRDEIHQTETCKRVAKAIMPVSEHYLRNALFVPGGRILAGAGTGRRVTLINCYVMDKLADDLGDIFRNLSESAMTMQQGGGIGVDFSTLRPRGAMVHSVEAEASGPLAFMDTWDAMCKTVMSAGTRRGAMMATMRCDHPDVLDFIKVKRETGRLTQFNVSVLVTDAFMKAVAADDDWHLSFPVEPFDRRSSDYVKDGKKVWVYKTVRARELWDEIIKNTYDHAEPGVIFIDRVNARNNLNYCEEIACTNPCGEQPLPPYGDCCLGAVNLALMVKDPWSDKARVDTELLQATVAHGVTFLDNVLDVTNYPLTAQRDEAANKRRIGLGVMGLANMLQQLRVRYGSEASFKVTDSVFSTIANAAYRRSAELAEERGRFPAYDERILLSPNLTQLDYVTFDILKRFGLRNGVILTVAPTGTTSIFAGNVSGGIEPVFRHEYTRDVLQADGSKKTSRVYDWGYLEYRTHFGRESIGDDYMVTAKDLTVDDHLTVMAAAQRWVDASISKTINCPEDMKFEEFKGVYERAYGLGCKSCTTYRPNPESGRGHVIAEIQEGGDRHDAVQGTPDRRPVGQPAAVGIPPPAPRPDALPGVTYKVKPGEHAYYVTITNYDQRPYELFISTKESQHSDWTAALGRMISAIWRRGGDTTFVQEELKQIHSPHGGFWLDRRYVPSVVAAIGGIIERHTSTGFARTYIQTTPAEIREAVCPKCQSVNTHRGEGCLTCFDCGWSNCG